MSDRNRWKSASTSWQFCWDWGYAERLVQLYNYSTSWELWLHRSTNLHWRIFEQKNDVSSHCKWSAIVSSDKKLFHPNSMKHSVQCRYMDANSYLTDGSVQGNNMSTCSIVTFDDEGTRLTLKTSPCQAMNDQFKAICDVQPSSMVFKPYEVTMDKILESGNVVAAYNHPMNSLTACLPFCISREGVKTIVIIKKSCFCLTG